MQYASPVIWTPAKVTSPHLPKPVSVLAAKDIPYFRNSNRFQNLSLYVPHTAETATLVGKPADAFTGFRRERSSPASLVHIHGGAWRDPELTSASIEPTVAHAFDGFDASSPILAVASINYTISKYPTHPRLPYDPITENHSDPARDAMHPQHVSDVLHAFDHLRAMGLDEGSYILSGHSCGACLAFQAILQSPEHYGLDGVAEPPRPAAMLGLNGLYDLVGLVYELGASHEHLRDDYEMFLSNAFGPDKAGWPAVSPARFDPTGIAARVKHGRAPSLIMLDQSPEDQLVPMNQREKLEAALDQVKGLRTIRGHRCTGEHAAAWEQGVMIWNNLRDLLDVLHEEA